MTPEHTLNCSYFDAERGCTCGLVYRLEIHRLESELSTCRAALTQIANNAEWGCYAHTGEDHRDDCNVGIARKALADPPATPEFPPSENWLIVFEDPDKQSSRPGTLGDAQDFMESTWKEIRTPYSNVRKQWRTPAGPWQDAETGS